MKKKKMRKNDELTAWELIPSPPNCPKDSNKVFPLVYIY